MEIFPMFRGSMVALVTPMDEKGDVAQKALAELVEWHIASKTDALIIAGTTGESATLDPDEQFELISSVVKQVAKRIPVIAGTGTNCTRTTITLTENAKRAGADACLLVTPYYNKPTQQGLYQHYKWVAQKTTLPIILYNVPGRTACDLLPETVALLADIKNIIGIKEATGKIERAQDILKRCSSSFEIYSGDDASALDLMKQGARGVISVTANIAPLKMHTMCAALRHNRIAEAEKINAELMGLHEHLFVEANPIPVKWALHKMGKIPNGIRLPLVPLDPQYHQRIKEAMQRAGVMIT
jgi:4-hydroxy-tetrahydrodipicolinate synthase